MKTPLLTLGLAIVLAVTISAQFGFRYTNLEVRDQIRRQKLDTFIVPILSEAGIDCWVTLTRDPSDDMTNVIWERDQQLDPIAEFIGAEGVTVPAAFIFTTSGDRIAIVSSTDARAVTDTGLYRQVITYTYDRRRGHSEYLEQLGQVIRRLDPKRIGLNYSEDEPVADGLSFGMKTMFDGAVGPELAGRVSSAEQVVISIWNRKVPLEVQLIEKSARKSATLTEEALRAVKPGVTTTRGLFDDIRRRVREEGMQPGWQEWWCPTVSVGTFRLSRPPADKVIEHGDLIVVNSGFLVEGHMSDLNKVAYVLREGETDPPPVVRRLFDTCLEATRAAVAVMKPGATGFEVDKAARDVVVAAGFEEYPHATGHTTGLWVHGLGVILGPHWGAYGHKVDMPLHEGDIYAVEPSATTYSAEHGGNLRMHLQEMVIIERQGARYLTPPVTELMLIK